MPGVPGKGGGLRSTSWKPGQVVNPGGRPKLNTEAKKAAYDLKALAKEYTSEALAKIVAIMRSDAVPANTVLTAAIHVLDRGHGKPRETVDNKVEVTIEDLVLAAARRRVELSEAARNEAVSEGRDEKEALN